ncbi:hypothetical protein ACFC08_28805 [Streptomyces sp. NPDC056112]|uniref:hypothetical protein n=1 Tax=Streptomyces sp. NPDC056112 TaxID=3345715 RepID=UPI0035D89ADF
MSKETRRQQREADRRAIEAQKRISRAVNRPGFGSDDNPVVAVRGGANASTTFFRAFFGG